MGGTRRCPRCGEEYSDTYKRCPFCEEEDAIRAGKPLRRRSGKRLETGRRRGGVGGVMLLVCGVIIVLVLVYVFFGDQAQDALGIRTEQDAGISAAGDASPDTGADAGTEANSGGDVITIGGDGQETGGVPDDTEQTQEPAADDTPAEPLALSQSSIAINAGDTARLTVSGGAGDVTWTSSNDQIATVDGEGAVTGVAGGKVTVTAACGGESASCEVTVAGDAWVSTASLSLNKTDFTLPEGDPDVQMRVSGTDSPVTWTSGDTDVVTVSGDGVVTRVGRGKTEITASVDGQTLTCTVRCP